MNGSILAESLVAMSGIWLSRRPSELLIRGAASYPDRIRRRLASFLAADAPERLKWERTPAQTDLWRDLNAEIDPEELAAFLLGVPDDMAMGYPIVVQAARDYIRERWPIFDDTSLGLRNVELSPDEYGDVWQLTRTLNDPQTLFDDMDALALLPEQVDAFSAVYPGLYEATVNVAFLLLQPFVQVEGMTGKKKALSFVREEVMRTLLRLPMDAPFAPPQTEQQPGTEAQKQRSAKSNERRTTTPTERIADKAAAE